MLTPLVLAMSVAFQSGQAPPPRPSEAELAGRGVYAYGRYALDLLRLQENRYRGPRPVIDCSDQETLCIRGDVFRIAVPKDCSPIVAGASWEFGGVPMQAVRDDSTSTGSARPVYYLINDRKNVAYEYRLGTGIVAIFHDPDDQIDFRGLAVAGELDEWRRQNAANARGLTYYNFITTFDALGSCSVSP